MVRSIAHLFFRTAGRHPDRPAFKERGGDGRVWTYRDLAAAVRETALGFSDMGVGSGDRVGLFADSSVEWIMADLAILALGAADVPRGTDTAPSEVDYLVRHSGARMVIVENGRARDELAPLFTDIPGLRCIVLRQDASRADAPRSGPSLKDVRERGRERLAEGALLESVMKGVKADNTATIVYTSGTTGRPKGVVLSHENILHNIRGARQVIDFDREDVFLSILPAWHMFERLIEYAAISKGCLTIYTSRRSFKKDLLRERPTILAAVPRVYELLYDEAHKQLSSGPSWRRGLVALLLRSSALYRSAQHIDPLTGETGSSLWRCLRPLQWVADAMLFSKLRAALGGRLRTLVSGGGSLPVHVDRFFDTAGLPILNGYGLTETAPLVSVRRPHRRLLSTVGPPIPGTQIEIRDRSGGPVRAGETGVLHVRGPQVMSGYYKDRETTSRVLDAKGFLDTGDLARLWPSGELEITGRAKDTIVLSGGENVEPEPIENALRLSPLIEQVVVVGQDRKQLGALIVPNLEQLTGRIPVSASGTDPGESILEKRRQLIRTEIDRLLHRDRGFKPFEQVRRFAVTDEPFSVESGELTETLKLKRHVIAEQRGGLIDSMFR